MCANACSGLPPCRTVKGLDIIPRFKTPGGVLGELLEAPPPPLVVVALNNQPCTTLQKSDDISRVCVTPGPIRQPPSTHVTPLLIGGQHVSMAFNGWTERLYVKYDQNYSPFYKIYSTNTSENYSIKMCKNTRFL